MLDPFCGSGTTGVAAIEQNRKFIGIDSSRDYLLLAKKRIESVVRDKECVTEESAAYIAN